MAVADWLEAFRALPPWSQTLTMMTLTLVLGWLIITLVRRHSGTVMERSRLDATLRSFLTKVIASGAWVALAVVLLTQAGVDLTALLGGLAIGGFIVGFALKDTLGNLAAGVMLLFYRPFNVGDYIAVGGHDGDVLSLGMALTVLKSADGRIISLPNGAVLGGSVVNHTRNPIRRADVMVGIAYDDDIDTAIRAIMQALATDTRVLSEPAADVRITELGDSGVQLQVRPWVATPDVWLAKAQLHGTVKRALEAAGCTIPFPQHDVHFFPAPTE